MKIQQTAALLITAVITLGASNAMANAEAGIKNLPTDKLAWETTAEGVGFAPLIGERFSEACMAMLKLPAGLVT